MIGRQASTYMRAAITALKISGILDRIWHKQLVMKDRPVQGLVARKACYCEDLQHRTGRFCIARCRVMIRSKVSDAGGQFWMMSGDQFLVSSVERGTAFTCKVGQREWFISEISRYYSCCLHLPLVFHSGSVIV